MWANEGKWGSCMIRIPDSWKQIFGSGNQVFGLFCFGWSLIRPWFPPCFGCCWIADEPVRVAWGHLAEALWELVHPKSDFTGFYLLPLNRITCQMLFFSNPETLLGTCKWNPLLDFPTVVSSVLLYSSQDVVSFSNGHLAELGAVGLMFESVKPYQSFSTVIQVRLPWCQGWAG